MRQRTKWTDSGIAEQVLSLSKKFSRMPSAREMRLSGRGDLADVVAKKGGFRKWAVRLGLDLKSSETKLGQDYEAKEAAFLAKEGFAVKRQTTKNSFDLLVNSKRVDVKVANKYSCWSWTGYSFAGMKRGVDCDFFDCLILGKRGVEHRLIIPATEIKVTTLTLTIGKVKNKTHWAMQYKDAIAQLR